MVEKICFKRLDEDKPWKRFPRPVVIPVGDEHLFTPTYLQGEHVHYPVFEPVKDAKSGQIHKIHCQFQQVAQQTNAPLNQAHSTFEQPLEIGHILHLTILSHIDQNDKCKDGHPANMNAGKAPAKCFSPLILCKTSSKRKNTTPQTLSSRGVVRPDLIQLSPE